MTRLTLGPSLCGYGPVEMGAAPDSRMVVEPRKVSVASKRKPRGAEAADGWALSASPGSRFSPRSLALQVIVQPVCATRFHRTFLGGSTGPRVGRL
jgi:hypothetical protein